MSPYEKMSGKRFDLNIFKNKVPLSDCWVNTANPGDKPINKLGSNNIKAVYLCYDSRRRGDFVYIPELKRITTCWHVTHCPREFTLLGDSVTVRRYKERGDLPTATAAPTATGAQAQVPHERGGARHPAGRGGQDRRADRAAATLRQSVLQRLILSGSTSWLPWSGRERPHCASARGAHPVGDPHWLSALRA